MDRVEKALREVDRDAFVMEANGLRFVHSTATEEIASKLRLLDVRQGDRVLEIGTGSGFSTALLSCLVGESGEVVSLDIDPDVTARAQHRFAKQGVKRVTAVTRDGREGMPENGPFDRFIAWTTADYLPDAWLDSLREGGVIVAPFALLPVAKMNAVVRLRKEGGKPQGECIISGSYISMAKEPIQKFFGPERQADAMWMEGGEVVAWGSGIWMKGLEEVEKQEWLRLLRSASPMEPLLQAGEDGRSFRAWLMAANPDELTTADWKEQKGDWLGAARCSDLALLDVYSGETVASGKGNAREKLEAWLGEWRKWGRPGFYRLKPEVKRAGKDWLVRAALTEKAV